MAPRPQIIRRFRLELYRMPFRKTLTDLPITTDSTNTNQNQTNRWNPLQEWFFQLTPQFSRLLARLSWNALSVLSVHSVSLFFNDSTHWFHRFHSFVLFSLLFSVDFFDFRSFTVCVRVCVRACYYIELVMLTPRYNFFKFDGYSPFLDPLLTPRPQLNQSEWRPSEWAWLSASTPTAWDSTRRYRHLRWPLPPLLASPQQPPPPPPLLQPPEPTASIPVTTTIRPLPMGLHSKSICESVWTYSDLHWQLSTATQNEISVCVRARVCVNPSQQQQHLEQQRMLQCWHSFIF